MSKKPKCPLIGQDGNIFNLMGIASKTLMFFPKQNPKKLHSKYKKAVKCFIYPKHLTAFIMYEIFKNSFYKATLIPL